jgi:UDP-glucose 4-epimerase
MISTGEHKLINLGSNTGHSLKELIQVAGSILGYKIPVVLKERREGDPDFLVAENTKAFSELEWEPKLTLNQMINDHLAYKKSVHN